MVNNDYTHWEMYAIGGSADPTINSQGNRYLAPVNPFAKEVITDHKNLIILFLLNFWYFIQTEYLNMNMHGSGYKES